MRIPQRARSRAVNFNMTPMIDVVFQLIIFFLVSSHLAKQEVQLELPLPAADSGQQREESERPRLVVNVLEDGQWLVSGRRIAEDQWQQRLQEAIDEYGTQLEVTIRADRQVPYRYVMPLKRTCYRLGIRDVTYSVYRSQDVQ
jgi:biopolymer transport protein ExbD